MPTVDRYLEDYSVGEVVEADGVSLAESDVLDFALRYDPQPFHLDREAAQRSIFGGLIASGWQTGALALRMLIQAGLIGKGSMGSPGLDELRFLKPVRPGDTLYAKARIESVRESVSKPDRGIVLVQYWVENHKGETVMSFKGNQLIAKRPK
ncbi:MaoC family dehydratase [Ferrovibrio sp.]|uniref:MaoC family dehydratase n=1 Tax=Ferrovibrio sp. TaxID=1917215 RepID=UPI0025B8559D|nr:MaoC family dehydratase [Ferrovibrio sp.]MBX3456115.1 MaoC family dehydratase [Ferrovibrio sp.]